MTGHSLEAALLQLPGVVWAGKAHAAPRPPLGQDSTSPQRFAPSSLLVQAHRAEVIAGQTPNNRPGRLLHKCCFANKVLMQELQRLTGLLLTQERWHGKKREVLESRSTGLRKRKAHVSTLLRHREGNGSAKHQGTTSRTTAGALQAAGHPGRKSREPFCPRGTSITKRLWRKRGRVLCTWDMDLFTENTCRLPENEYPSCQGFL